METKASAKYIRISPRKARLVVDLIRGRDVGDAQQILDYSPKAAARAVGKILNSAIANAEHNNGLDPDELYVCRAYVDEGPTLKRFRPRAMGRATRINKRTSHITLVLDEREPRPESKRRRFRRPVRRKAKEEPEVVEGELEEEELEGEEEEITEAAIEEEESSADEESEEAGAEAEAEEPEEAEAEAEPEEPEDAEAEAEPEEDEERPGDAEADEGGEDAGPEGSGEKPERKPKEKKTRAKKSKEADDSESED